MGFNSGFKGLICGHTTEQFNKGVY